jgi:hypothetical protein
MMMARKIIGALVVGTMGAAPAFADDFSDRIVRQLERQGFSKIETEQTWLGRTRIVAEGSDGQREIIVNPNTGEILRDLWLIQGGDASGSLINARGDASGNNDDDDSDDANDDNGRDNDDNGGNSGGGNSGGSSGGSNGGGDDD